MARTITGPARRGAAPAAPRERLRGVVQRFVDLGPAGPLALARARLSARRAGWRRRDDGTGITPESWFARLYEGDADPWGYGASRYEERRYELTLAALPRARYRHGYEPGCSIGLLSLGLAGRCDRLVCSDYSPAAVAAAGERLAHLPHVHVARHELPRDYPDDRFDLVVLGDVGMYLAPRRLDELTDRVAASLEGGGHLVAVHGHHLSPDIFQSGDQVHARIRRHPALRAVAGYRDAAFRLDVWERRT